MKVWKAVTAVLALCAMASAAVLFSWVPVASQNWGPITELVTPYNLYTPTDADGIYALNYSFSEVQDGISAESLVMTAAWTDPAKGPMTSSAEIVFGPCPPCASASGSIAMSVAQNTSVSVSTSIESGSATGLYVMHGQVFHETGQH